jgi:hypothetical protein
MTIPSIAVLSITIKDSISKYGWPVPLYTNGINRKDNSKNVKDLPQVLIEPTSTNRHRGKAKL